MIRYAFQLVPSAISGMAARLGATARTNRDVPVQTVLVLQDANLDGWEAGVNSEVGFNPIRMLYTSVPEMICKALLRHMMQR